MKSSFTLITLTKEQRWMVELYMLLERPLFREIFLTNIERN